MTSTWSISNTGSGGSPGRPGEEVHGPRGGVRALRLSARDVSTYSLHEYNQVKDGAPDRTRRARGPDRFASDGR